MAESGAGPGGAGDALARRQDRDAVRLLERFARVEDQPQRLIEACEAWARGGAAAAQAPGFDYLFGRIIRTRRAVAGEAEELARADGLSMALDAAGAVVEIDAALGPRIGAAPGDRVGGGFAAPLAELAARKGADGRPAVAEFTDPRGCRHLVEISDAGASHGARPLYAVRLLKLRLAGEAETYVRRVFALTSAEAEVLALALQRLEVGEIAAARGNRINTIRTHINSIIRKFGCHSLNAVVTSAFEIAYFLDAPRRPAGAPAPAAREGRAVAALADGARVDYAEGGDPRGRPLVLLHSLEYGHEPTPAFLERAGAAGWRVIAPFRPGFGGTTFAPHAAGTGILAGFLDGLGLENAVLVGLSTGAPAAIALAAARPCVARLVLVNYAFNALEKLKDVRPRWLAGLVDLVIRSPQSARFAAAAGRRLIAALGPERFFRTLYEGNAEDLEFLAAHPDLMARSGAILLGAHEEAVIGDLVASFAPNPEAEEMVRMRRDVLALRGANTHHASEAPMRAEAERLGVAWRRIERAGRCCVFQRPDAFFALLAAEAAGAGTGRDEPARALA